MDMHLVCELNLSKISIVPILKPAIYDLLSMTFRLNNLPPDLTAPREASPLICTIVKITDIVKNMSSNFLSIWLNVKMIKVFKFTRIFNFQQSNASVFLFVIHNTISSVQM